MNYKLSFYYYGVKFNIDYWPGHGSSFEDPGCGAEYEFDAVKVLGLNISALLPHSFYDWCFESKDFNEACGEAFNKREQQDFIEGKLGDWE